MRDVTSFKYLENIGKDIEEDDDGKKKPLTAEDKEIISRRLADKETMLRGLETSVWQLFEKIVKMEIEHLRDMLEEGKDVAMHIKGFRLVLNIPQEIIDIGTQAEEFKKKHE